MAKKEFPIDFEKFAATLNDSFTVLVASSPELEPYALELGKLATFFGLPALKTFTYPYLASEYNLLNDITLAEGIHNYGHGFALVIESRDSETHERNGLYQFKYSSAGVRYRKIELATGGEQQVYPEFTREYNSFTTAKSSYQNTFYLSGQSWADVVNALSEEANYILVDADDSSDRPAAFPGVNYGETKQYNCSLIGNNSEGLINRTLKMHLVGTSRNWTWDLDAGIISELFNETKLADYQLKITGERVVNYWQNTFPFAVNGQYWYNPGSGILRRYTYGWETLTVDPKLIYKFETKRYIWTGTSMLLISDSQAVAGGGETGGGAEVTDETVNTALESFTEVTEISDEYFIPFIGKLKISFLNLITALRGKFDLVYSKLNHSHSYNDLSERPDLTIYQTKAAATLNTIDKTIVGGINEVLDIAKGAQQAQSEMNYETVIGDMNGFPLDDRYGNIGQSILIETVDVPDLWISGKSAPSVPYTYVSDEQFINDIIAGGGHVKVGYYHLSVLETAKVNLTDYYTKEQIAILLADYLTAVQVTGLLTNKVDKEAGKELYPTADKTKLAGIAAGAQVNVIEKIKVGGVEQPVNNKTVELTIPNPDLSGYSTISERNKLERISVATTDSIIPDLSKDIFQTDNNGTIAILIDTFTNLPTFSCTKLVKIKNIRASSMNNTFRTTNLVQNGITYQFVNFSASTMVLAAGKKAEISYLFDFVDSMNCMVHTIYSIQP
ncbi:MAG TPA: hypothetical protein VK152_06690 [Paludibacter sp.]|nr:hypothetical protein [Paludibacter sp.]